MSRLKLFEIGILKVNHWKDIGYHYVIELDGSVLTAVGELLLFPTLLYAYRALELGYKVKFQKGETSIEVHKNEDFGQTS